MSKPERPDHLKADSDSDHESEHEFDDIPLQHKRPFGAGIARQRVAFVPASSTSAISSSSSTTPKTLTSAKDIHNYYTSLVLPSNSTSDTADADLQNCDICGTKIVNGAQHEHDLTLAHQVALPYNHPPRNLDRSRKGLLYLESYGWDADSRLAIGASGREGIRAPIKIPVKLDKMGIGAKFPKGPDGKLLQSEKKKESFGAKEIRKRTAADKKKAEKLRGEFYSNIDLEKYLGSEGA